MAFEQTILDLPFIASANVTAITWTGNPPVYASGGIAQFYIVVSDTVDGTNEAVTLASSTTVMPLGVAQDGPAVTAGQACRVRVIGVTKVVSGGAVTYGQQVQTNASGQAVAIGAAGATSTFVLGIALSPATQAGDVITVLLTPGATTYINA